jgi:hypothetical protein
MISHTVRSKCSQHRINYSSSNDLYLYSFFPIIKIKWLIIDLFSVGHNFLYLKIMKKEKARTCMIHILVTNRILFAQKAGIVFFSSEFGRFH